MCRFAIASFALYAVHQESSSSTEFVDLHSQKRVGGDRKKL